MSIQFRAYAGRQEVAAMLEAPVRRMLATGEFGDEPEVEINTILAELDRMAAVKAAEEREQQRDNGLRASAQAAAEISPPAPGATCTARGWDGWRHSATPCGHKAKWGTFCMTHAKPKIRTRMYELLRELRAAALVTDDANLIAEDRRLRMERPR